jgi:actin-related protein 3
MTAPVVVIDNGTGFTKMGYAGNDEPTYIIPSTYAGPDPNRVGGDVLSDLDFAIGQEAIDLSHRSKGHPLSYPMKAGIVQDWDKMERTWQHCIYRYLRIEPEEHGFILTEPPANPPENREYVAEVMFETFGVKSLHIAVQGVLALTAARGFVEERSTGETGTVIDSGDGVTHVVPIVDGYVLTNAIRHIPLAGRTITNYILERLREREKGIPPDEALQVAQRIKERYCYVCPDLADEFNKYDAEPEKYFNRHEDKSKDGKPYAFDVGYEKFIGPELFFNPSIFSTEHTEPIHKVVDSAIMSSPIDCRKPLYSNIVLSGGTTMFKGFDKRLQLDLDEIIGARIRKTKEQSGRDISIPVKVVSHRRQRYAVWNGGSVLGASPKYAHVAHTRKDYEEHGPRICRGNAMFGDILH